MNIVKEIITSQRKIQRLKRENDRLKRENVRLRSQLKAQAPRKPTISDRTSKKEQITPAQVLMEYLWGKEAVNG